MGELGALLVAWTRQNRWWLRLGLGLVVLLVLLTVAGLLLYDYWDGRASLTSNAPMRKISHTDLNPFGANLFLHREVEPWKIEKTLDMVAEAGIAWVKVHVPWEEIEPTRKGVYLDPTTQADTWAKYDRILTACEERGLQVVARLDRPPDWAREDSSYKERPPDNLEDYGDFCSAFCERFQGRIYAIQVWNEPNIFPEWGNRAVDPEGYVALLRVAYARIKEADPNVLVLSAPLAITLGQPHPEPGQWISMSDLDFLEGMYRAGAADFFDILGANAFGMDRPPEDPPSEDVLNFSRLLLQREIMERYGDGDKAVWVNEFGWNAAPATMPSEKLVWRRVDEAQQAEYSVRAIDMARDEWPWCGVIMVWYFRQVGNITPDQADYYFRMVDPDFTPRPLYWAIQEAATSQPPPGPGVYQETHASVERRGDWATVVDRQALGDSLLVSEQAGDSLTLRFMGTGVDLYIRRATDGGRLQVKVDGASVAGLSQDAAGASYLELDRSPARSRQRLQLVDGLHAGQHTVELIVVPRDDGIVGPCAVDGFAVLGLQDSRFPWTYLGLVLAALGLDIWFLVRTWGRLRWLIRGR